MPEGKARTIVYVKGGELNIPDNYLHHELNQIRYKVGDITIRTDPEESESKRVAEEWAKIRNMPLQATGKPNMIIVPGFPRCIVRATQKPGRRTEQVSRSQIDQEAHEIGRQACAEPRTAGHADRTPAGRILRHLKYGTGKHSVDIIWLGATKPEKPAFVQAPY